MARLTGSLLIPWLLAAARDFGAVFGMRAVLPGVGLHCGRNLVNQVAPPLNTEDARR